MRRKGITPVHLYGKNTPSMSLQANSAELQRLVIRAGGTTPITVSVENGQAFPLAFVRQVQRHPVTEEILHVDFFQVPVAEVMRAEVPIYLMGDAPAVRMLNGVLLQALHAIEVECLPLDIPQSIEVDVSGLEDFEQGIYVSSINLGDSVTIITDPEEMITRVNAPRVVVEEEVLVAEAAEGEEVEAAAEEAEAQPAPDGSQGETTE